MKVLITGASSGIGREMAKLLAKKCTHLVLVGRDVGRLENLKEELETMAGKRKQRPLKVTAVSTDLTNEENCIRLHMAYPDIDFLINNAGFGDFGEFAGTSLEKEMRMIDTNVKAVHILMKLYLVDMVKKNRGCILNVASIAGFMPGPLMATYYATKSYVVRLSESVRKELQKRHSEVKISVLCPGPVETNFAKTANIAFHFNGKDARIIAKYALEHLNRFYIVPGVPIRMSRALLKMLPTPVISEIMYYLQSRRKCE